MPRDIKPHWRKQTLSKAVRASTSIRQVLTRLGLKEAGGNYEYCARYIQQYRLSTDHFTGRGWAKGRSVPRKPVYAIDDLLVKGSSFSSHKLKLRLFAAGLKVPSCEECGWSKSTPEGRTPVELDHINGDSKDNRLENLRILCPNCHSLKPTHRGSNIRLRRRGGESGKHATLKTL